MRVDIISKEFPPKVYGGAGVHVEELSKVLKEQIEVNVHCFDGERSSEFNMDGTVFGYDVPAEMSDANGALQTLSVDLQIAQKVEGADLLHSHTWYANMAGVLGSKLYDIPHILSAHSLEPLRPWKREQLGGGYEISSWAEREAYASADGIIAVSHGMAKDILKAYGDVIDPAKMHVVHNGITLSDFAFDPENNPEQAKARDEVIEQYGIDTSRPTALFVGRITRQKGLPYFMRAIKLLPKEIQVILCAGAPDTPEILAEVKEEFQKLSTGPDARTGLIWIEEMLPKNKLIAVEHLSDAFICPSVYEPLGIVNLEAMACYLPVVASATGGIPEVVEDGVTGTLVHLEQMQDGTGTPLDPDKFVADLAAAVTATLSDLDKAKAQGQAGYKRAEENFTWDIIGNRTIEVYNKVLAASKK